MAEAARTLGMYFATFKIRALKLGVYKPNQGGKGFKAAHNKIEDENLFIEGSATRREIIKRRLIKNQLIPYVCEICEQEPLWKGKKLVLVLDHRNGYSTDHRIENLRFLCPNCNSQQPTFYRSGGMADTPS
jgi:5-methylcytosine-specific restriction endonuclease McrA